MVKKLRNISRNLHVASFVFENEYFEAAAWDRNIWEVTCGVSKYFVRCFFSHLVFCSVDSKELFCLLSFHQSEPTCRTAVQERSDKLRQIAVSLRLIMVR